MHVAQSLIAFLAVSLLVPAAVSKEYKIDPSHSEVSFKVKHLGISSVRGNFTKFSGSFYYDPEAVERSVVSATIETDSIDTNDEKRDAHLMSADFLEVETYPVMTFSSNKVVDAEDDGFKVHGDLTLHGVTKPVVLEVAPGGVVKDPWGNLRAGFTAETVIDRQDFGVSFSKILETGQLLVGNEVRITLEIEGIAEKAGG